MSEDRADLASRRIREEMRLIIREELTNFADSLRPASVEWYENGKGERSFTVKEYGRDVYEAFASATAIFREGLVVKALIGTADDPNADAGMIARARQWVARKARKAL